MTAGGSRVREGVGCPDANGSPLERTMARKDAGRPLALRKLAIPQCGATY